ncbi:FAD-binding oxidoreductase [Dactylosporangium vinaceum]|uniref:NAD(P)/FAD-dependent oxidoreductase n=1 Tax=Dactylosporangium vinaceum TaxID=53362 RepID=A0ABV5M5J3_9ACTN|nr:FAD-binding oxidoreductase [Dactylosporangium vinaceum]UAB95586.1 FAD-binding oxidoreductase [Dactylosporangium vinaceum]
MAIIGGGVAGLSLAAELAELDGRLVERSGGLRPELRIVLLERENQFGYHSTGRSISALSESLGSPEQRALTRASRTILDALGAESGTPLLRARPVVWVADADHLGALNALLTANPALRGVDPAAAQTLCPVLRPEATARAAVERTAQDVDVDALQQQYRDRATAAGAVLRTAIGLESGTWDPGRSAWTLTTDRGELEAGRIVDAAGPWADAVAARLGVPVAGLTSYRRTVAIATAERVGPAWPLVVDVADRFYFRPERGGLLVSPADETPSPPTDAEARPQDVSVAMERVAAATTLQLSRARTSWAGLRTFAPDRNPIVGPDPQQDGFFWFAGLGGTGIQTAPALARLAAAQLLGEPYEVADLRPEALLPRAQAQ